MSRPTHTEPVVRPLDGQAVGRTEAEPRAARSLVVGEDLPMLELLAIAFRSEGYQVRSVAPAEAAEVAREWSPHLVVHDGFAVTRFERGYQKSVPALFLTSGDQLATALSGLTAGGGVHLIKPFSLEELLASGRSVLRAAVDEPTADSGVLRFADLELDEETYDVRRAGRPIPLTPTEFKLLRFLMRRPEKVLAKVHILDHVWPYDYSGDPRIVELYMFKLRRKIDRFHSPLIHTLRGRGYSLRLARR